MRIRTTLVPAAVLCLLVALPTAAATFSNPTSNDANSFEADILAPATDLSAVCGATITLDWTATIDMYPTGHRVLRGTTPGGPYNQISSITPRTTVTYDDTPAAGTYYYVVRAYYLNWMSASSNEVAASTGTCVPPAVSGLAPSSGPKTGGTSVVVSGSELTGATAVSFGGTPATGYVVDSDTQITATAPAGISVVDVRVTTPWGTSSNTVADDYTFDPVTYYVRTNGSDSNTGLTNTAGGAWLTIQNAAATMTAGDTVRVQPGIYAETVTPSYAGTAAGPITYLTDGLVVVDGGNTRCKAFDVVGTGYLVIDGFEITNQPDCGETDAAVDINNSNNVTVRNNIIHDTGRDAIFYKGTSANGLVENNLIYNIDDDGSTPIGGGNHVYRNNTFAGTITGWALENGLASNLFENNIFWVTAGNGAIQSTGIGTFNYNDYYGAVLPGTGNISSDPLFVIGYHLSHIAAGQGSNSPAIDAGDDTAANLGLDTKTTRTDSVTDTSTIDLGYHYNPTTVPPSVSGLAPSSGWEAGGMSVVISGSDFTGATAVSFGATPATGYVVDSDSQITATSPAGTGVVDVALTAPLGTSANTAADDYTYMCAPTWWDSAYGYRAEITVSAGTDSLTTGYSVGVGVDHAQLVAGGKSLASGADVRLLRWDGSGCSWSELDRVLQEGSSWAVVDTTLWFSLQTDIAANADDAGYFLYYGNPAATVPPADKTKVYAVWDDFDDSTLDTGWSLDAIGSVAGGAVSESGTVVRISATSTGDIWYGSDNLYHLARDVSGDFLAESYTTAAGGTHDGWSKYGGVHLRNSSSANSVNRNMSEVYTTAGSTNSYRLATGGPTAEQLGQQYDYNRIIRVGDTSRAFNSADGATWGEIGTGTTFTSSLSDPVRIGPLLAGLSASSHWVDVDWFKIRLYVDDEPTAAVGTEETKP